MSVGLSGRLQFSYWRVDWEDLLSCQETPCNVVRYIWAAESAKRVSNAEMGLKQPIRSQMLNEKGVKFWKGPQKLVKMSNLVTAKIP